MPNATIFTSAAFTITKIVLTNWYADNLIDKPDPWIRIMSGDDADNVLGRTDYLYNCTDGESCTYSNLSITIKNVYDRISFRLYDYNFGYSDTGSSFISGVYTTNFISYWGKTSFVMKTDNIQLTIYGTWN